MAGMRRGTAAVLVALALVGAGCTGDDGAAGPGTTTGPTGTTIVGGCPQGPGTPSWIHDRYDLTSLLDAGHDGGGVRVALLTVGESADETAVLAGAGCAGSDAVLVQEAADGTDVPPAGDRATLDAQAVLATAPGLDELLVLTVAPDSDLAVVDALATVAAGAFGRIDVLVAPPSRCLEGWDITALEGAERTLARLAEQGVWVVAGTGDAGSTPCVPPADACAAPGAASVATTGYPASSAHVLAVGGTMVLAEEELDAPPTPDEVALGPDGILGTADDGTGPPVTSSDVDDAGSGDEVDGDEVDGNEVDGDVEDASGEGRGDGEDGGDGTGADGDGEPELPLDVVWSERWLPGATGCAATGGGEAGAGPGIAAPDWQATGLRQLPDVAALAGVPGVVAVGRDGRPVSATGTGVAAALTAGGLASVRSALRSAGTDLDGPLAEVIWLVAGDQAVLGDEAGAPIVEDVDTGSNDLLDVGCCPAGAGYDLASGWGVLRFGALALALAEADGLRSWPAEASPPVGTAPPGNADDGDAEGGAAPGGASGVTD